MPWLTGKPASIADAFGRWLCGGERWGGDESQKLHRSSIAVISKTKRPKSQQLWRLLDQGRSKREEDPSPLNRNIKLWAQTTLWPQRNTGRKNCRLGLCKFTYEMGR